MDSRNSQHSQNPQSRKPIVRNDRLVFLRVKLKSLAAEAKIIREETQRAKRQRRTDLINGLTEHRRFAVRRAARHTFLAYGYLRDRRYLEIEHPNSEPLESRQLREIARMVVKYGPEGHGYYPPDGPHVVKAEEALRTWMAEGRKIQKAAAG